MRFPANASERHAIKSLKHTFSIAYFCSVQTKKTINTSLEKKLTLGAHKFLETPQSSAKCGTLRIAATAVTLTNSLY